MVVVDALPLWVKVGSRWSGVEWRALSQSHTVLQTNVDLKHCFQTLKQNFRQVL
jgi:hypothetical protein